MIQQFLLTPESSHERIVKEIIHIKKMSIAKTFNYDISWAPIYSFFYYYTFKYVCIFVLLLVQEIAMESLNSNN